MAKLKPSDFAYRPRLSKCYKMEPESVAENIMVIFARTGNVFRDITFEEYRTERLKDGKFHYFEKEYFDEVVYHCSSAVIASNFSPVWKAVFERDFEKLKNERKRDKTSCPIFVSDQYYEYE